MKDSFSTIIDDLLNQTEERVDLSDEGKIIRVINLSGSQD